MTTLAHVFNDWLSLRRRIERQRPDTLSLREDAISAVIDYFADDSQEPEVWYVSAVEACRRYRDADR